MSTLSLYILTAAISVIAALVLAYLAGMTGHAKVADKKEAPIDHTKPDPELEERIAIVIADELGDVLDSKKRVVEIARAVSSVLNEEVESRMSMAAHDIGKKYEAIINEKTKNEAVAWNKYDKELREKKQTEAVIRSIAEGLVVVDSKGNVVMINPAAEKLLGTSKKEKLGKSVLDGMKEEQMVSMAKNSPDREDKEIELISQQDETKKILRASSAIIENENGQTVGMVSVLSDITKQKELDSLKANFIASISHELRTPLVAIDKSIDLILTNTVGDVPPQQSQLLTIAHRNIKRLSLLINDLLDLSKLEAGKMEFRRQPASIEIVINEAVDSLRTWADTKSISIHREIESGLPEIEIDPNRVIQVLNNLIGNSIKFTPKDGTIIVKAVSRSKENTLIVSVEDNGIGIPKEALPKVFDKFYQTGERTASDISGTGIGLSIAREIVEQHGGKIWADSEKDKGTKFSFTFPLK